MNINSLTDGCLYSILAQLPLPNLLLAGQVCNRWNELKWSICRRTHSLTVLLGPNAAHAIHRSAFTIMPLAEECSQRNHITIDHLYHDTVCDLLEHFPNVTSFCMAARFVSSLEISQVVLLLEGWSHKLKTLKLWFEKTYQKPGQELANTINHLPVVRHLTLDVKFNLGLGELPILAQLDHFYLDTEMVGEKLIRLLSGGGGYKLKRIGFGTQIAFNDESYLDLCETISPDLASRITHLPYRPGFLRFPQDEVLARFCAQFSALRSISVFAGTISIPAITAQLAPLKQLQHLELGFDFQLQPHHTNWSPLLSVKVLILTLVRFGHQAFTSNRLPQTFPSIAALRIRFHFDKCADCGYERCQQDRGTKESRDRCLRLYWGEFKSCAKLKKIFVYDFMYRQAKDRVLAPGEL